MASRDYRTYPGRIHKPPRGICRWCGIVILRGDGTVNNRRTFCSDVCVTHYLLRADPQKMRQHIFLRDNGKCADCGFEHESLRGEWEADHVKPLMIAHGDPTFWEPENVVILCRDPCHKAKTRYDRQKYRQKDRRKVRAILQAMMEEDE